MKLNGSADMKCQAFITDNGKYFKGKGLSGMLYFKPSRKPLNQLYQSESNQETETTQSFNQENLNINIKNFKT